MFNKILTRSIGFLFLAVFLLSFGTSSVATSSKQKSEMQVISNYNVVYTLEKKRYDGGKNYYVLINPVNLYGSTFKESIKKIIRKIVSEKGDKISIDIFDNSNALEIHYKGYGLMTLGRVFTKRENKELAQHHIAGFDGELKTGLYLNTLYFSPSKYVDGVEFNPKSQ